MTIEEYAKDWKLNGISIVLDRMTVEFAESWARIVLANYLIASGVNQFKLGESMLAPPQPEASKVIM